MGVLSREPGLQVDLGRTSFSQSRSASQSWWVVAPLAWSRVGRPPGRVIDDRGDQPRDRQQPPGVVVLPGRVGGHELADPVAVRIVDPDDATALVMVVFTVAVVSGSSASVQRAVVRGMVQRWRTTRPPTS